MTGGHDVDKTRERFNQWPGSCRCSSTTGLVSIRFPKRCLEARGDAAQCSSQWCSGIRYLSFSLWFLNLLICHQSLLFSLCLLIQANCALR